MSRSLVVAEIIDGALSDVTAQAVTAACALGGEVVLALVAPDPLSLASAASYVGVTELVTVVAPGSDRDHEQMAQAVGALVADVAPDVIIAGFTIRSTAYAAAVAHERDLALAADVVKLAVGVDGGMTATRSIYGGRVHAELEFPAARPVLALVRPSVWEGAEAGPAVSPRSLDVALTPSRVRSVELMRPAGDLDLSRSDVILSVGRGVGGPENIGVFADIAKRLGVELGASRPVIDAGWLPSVHQVGQTGVTVKPRLYVALGISGALHHLAGMQGSKTIVAVNTDRDAPIFGYADIGAVADIHDVAVALQSLI